MYYLYRVMCGMIINQGKDTSEWYERHKSNTVMLPSTTVKYTVRGHNIYIKKKCHEWSESNISKPRMFMCKYLICGCIYPCTGTAPALCVSAWRTACDVVAFVLHLCSSSLTRCLKTIQRHLFKNWVIIYSNNKIFSSCALLNRPPWLLCNHALQIWNGVTMYLKNL